MTVTPELLARLRAMIGEAEASETYPDEVLTTVLTATAYDLANAVYDLHAAAAQVWEEKWARLSATVFDFSADGRNVSKSQLVANARQQVQYHRSRRRVRSARLSLVGSTPSDDTEGRVT